MKRILEISAASLEEARKLATRQLLEGEAILGEEVVATAVKGLFGTAGSDQTQVRFTLGADRTATLLDLLGPVCQTLGAGEVTFTTRTDPEQLTVQIEGEDAIELVGRHGRTIDALEYLCNIIHNRGCENRQRVTLDVGGYRAQRHGDLIELATRMARKATDTGRPVELEPMSTVDRRTVHLALKELGTVSTVSKGIEPMRKVVIVPLKAGREQPRPPVRREPRSRQRERPVAHEPENDRAPANSGSVPMFMGEGDDD